MSTKISDNNYVMFHEVAEIARSLANAHRLILLEHVSQGERSVEKLAELAGISIANASQHLQQLKRAGFVQSRREGKNILYQLGNGPVQNMLVALQEYVEFHHNEISTFLTETLKSNKRERFESLSRKELLSRLNEGDVTLLDVRPYEEYCIGHLPGAINIPVNELEGRLSELSKEHEVIAYCRGPYCVLSLDAMKFLKEKGYKVRCLEDGFPQWKAAGLRLEIEKD